MNNTPQILIVGPDTSALGGISTVARLYEENGLFDENIVYLSSYQDGNVFFKIFYFGKFLIKYILYLTKNKNIKIIHIKAAQYGSFFRKAQVVFWAKIFGKKIIFHVHGGVFDQFYYNSPLFLKKNIQKTLNKADLILVLSEKWKEKLSEICSNKNIQVLYNPIEIKTPNLNNKNEVSVIFMGILDKRKGVFDIIEAAKYIKSERFKISLYGDGNKEILNKLIKENNLEKKLEVNGWISGVNKENTLKNADILILPSYNEGLPMSILEAMAVGLPVISTPVGGISEAVQNGINGFLIEPGDYKSLAEKIDLLAGNKELREKMGQESYKIAAENFDVKIIINQLKQIYAEMLVI